MAERTWLVLREQGAIIEEAVDDDEGDEHVEEKGLPMSFDEKIALHAGELVQDIPPGVVDIPHPGSGAKEAASPHSSHSDGEVDVGT